MTIKEEIINAIELLIDKKLSTYASDITYISAIKKVNANGTYVITDRGGTERAVKCCIPNLALSVGQIVYIKVPAGKLKYTHICGVV